MKKIFYILISLAIACAGANAQYSAGNSLTRKCRANQASAQVSILGTGDVSIVPCPTKKTLFGGTVDFSGATVLGIAGGGGGITSLNGLTTGTQTFAVGAADTAVFNSATSTHTLRLPITSISGSSRTNFFPFFTAQNTLGKSPLTWNGTNYSFNNTALNNEFELNFTPSVTAGRFQVGDFNNQQTTYFDLVQSSGNATLAASNQISLQGGGISLVTSANSNDFTSDGINLGSGAAQFVLNFTGGQSILGDANDTVNSTRITVNDNQQSINFSGQNLLFSRDVNGGTANLTSDKPLGNVNFAAGQGLSGKRVFNTNVTGDSFVFATAQTNDATCFVKSVEAEVGLFTIRMNADCATETKVAYFVTK